MVDPMSYPGGKNGAGVFQRIICMMPPHQTYIEPFLGGGAILRLKRPAPVNIAMDLYAPAVEEIRKLLPPLNPACEARGEDLIARNGESSGSSRVTIADTTRSVDAR